MKMRTALRVLLLVALTLALIVPAHADVWLPSGLTQIADQAFMDAAWLSGNCTIPDGVTSIGAQAFHGCTGLTKLSIPASVKHIGSKAFYGCTGLSGNLVLSSDVTVADDAFENCPNLNVQYGKSGSSIETFTWIEENNEITITGFMGTGSTANVTLPSSIDGKPVTAIASFAFSSTPIKSISLPYSLKTIGEHAFSYCDELTRVSMPSSVSSIGRYAFYYCSKLEGTLQLIDTKIPSNAFTGCGSLTVMNFATNGDGTLTLSSCTGSRASMTVPAAVNGMTVTGVGREAFAFLTTLQQVNLPHTVTSIGQSAFYYCSALETISLPEGVTSIGASAFYNCTALRSVKLPKSVTSIGSMAFYNCLQLTGTMNFIDASINASAFSGCENVMVFCYTSNGSNLTLTAVRGAAAQITVPAQVSGRAVTALGPQAFYYCPNVKTIALPDSFTSICDEAFYQCATLENVNIPASATSIGAGAFYRCSSLKSVNIPATVNTLGSQAFYGCTAMTSMSLGNVNAKIGAYAFADCTSLKSVNLPEGFTNFGNMSFTNSAWMDQKVANLALDITAGCTNDYDKALALHDWIVNNTAYDMTYTYYGPEGVLFHGTGVCNAYTLTYSMMLDAVGIANRTVTGTATDRYTGNSGGHAWTLVLINGSWLHVDTTWDDPVPNGRERHTYFGLTDAEMAKDHSWNTANYPAADGTTYTASLNVQNRSVEETTENNTIDDEIETLNTKTKTKKKG